MRSTASIVQSGRRVVALRWLQGLLLCLSLSGGCTCIRSRLLEEDARSSVDRVATPLPRSGQSVSDGTLVSWVGAFERWEDRGSGVARLEYVNVDSAHRSLPSRDEQSLPARFPMTGTGVRFIAEIPDVSRFTRAPNEWPRAGDVLLVTGRVRTVDGLVRLDDVGQRAISLQRVPESVADLVPDRWLLGVSHATREARTTQRPLVLARCGADRDLSRTSVTELLRLEQRLDAGSVLFGVAGDGIDAMREPHVFSVSYCAPGRRREVGLEFEVSQSDAATPIAELERLLAEDGVRVRR